MTIPMLMIILMLTTTPKSSTNKKDPQVKKNPKKAVKNRYNHNEEINKWESNGMS